MMENDSKVMIVTMGDDRNDSNMTIRIQVRGSNVIKNVMDDNDKDSIMTISIRSEKVR